MYVQLYRVQVAFAAHMYTYPLSATMTVMKGKTERRVDAMSGRERESNLRCLSSVKEEEGQV